MEQAIVAKTEKELADLEEKIEQVKSELQGLSDEELAFANGRLTDAELAAFKESVIPTMLGMY